MNPMRAETPHAGARSRKRPLLPARESPEEGAEEGDPTEERASEPEHLPARSGSPIRQRRRSLQRAQPCLLWVSYDLPFASLECMCSLVHARLAKILRRAQPSRSGACRASPQDSNVLAQAIRLRRHSNAGDVKGCVCTLYAVGEEAQVAAPPIVQTAPAAGGAAGGGGAAEAVALHARVRQLEVEAGLMQRELDAVSDAAQRSEAQLRREPFSI